jgi:hypothetical protein
MVRDIYYPHPEQVLVELHAEETLEGETLNLGGVRAEGGRFMVIAVASLAQPVVVPTDKVRPCRALNPQPQSGAVQGE